VRTRTPMKPGEDAFGQILLLALEGKPATEIVERDDGYIEVGNFGARAYLAPVPRWIPVERQGMRYVRGRVLDVGCGAGRVCLEGQRRGLEVVGIDVSPGAVEACRGRGVRDVRVLGIDDIDDSLGTFDTIVMYGNNFGLFGSPAKARRLLRRFHRLTNERGRIIATSVHVYRTDQPAHTAYHERNRRRGRAAGQLRLRIRFREFATPWFDYLIVSQEEMQELLTGSGWHVRRFIEDDGPLYCAVLEKD
jgi:SAM-dependent methyltransferase